MFLVVSLSDVHFGFEHIIFSPKFYLRARKIGRLERNFSIPAQDSFIEETREREEIGKYIDKYVTFHEYFDINLVVLGSIKIVSFITGLVHQVSL